MTQVNQTVKGGGIRDVLNPKNNNSFSKMISRFSLLKIGWENLSIRIHTHPAVATPIWILAILPHRKRMHPAVATPIWILAILPHRKRMMCLPGSVNIYQDEHKSNHPKYCESWFDESHFDWLFAQATGIKMFTSSSTHRQRTTNIRQLQMNYS